MNAVEWDVGALIQGVVITLISSALIWIVKFPLSNLHNKIGRCVVNKKEQNYYLNDHIDFLMIQFVKNIMYPLILIMFNIYVSVFTAFYKEKLGIKWIDTIIFVSFIIFYIVYFSSKKVAINTDDKNIPYSWLIIFGILCGFIIEIILANVCVLGRWELFVFICLLITLLQIIVNEILLYKARFYEQYACGKNKLFWNIKVIIMCAEVINFTAYILSGNEKILYVLEHIFICAIIIVLILEFIILMREQSIQLEKNIYLKDGTIATTFSDIKEGKNNTIEWKDGSHTMNVKKSNIVKIAYFNNFNPKEMKIREIVLTDGTKVNGYRYSNNSGWYGLCRKCNEGLEIELYPEAMVNMKQDENW